MQTYPPKELPTEPIRLDEFLSESVKSCFEILIQAPTANAGDILFGSKGAVSHFVIASGSAAPPLQNLKDMYVSSTAAGTKLIITVFRR
jgi:hypothetical protein